MIKSMKLFMVIPFFFFVVQTRAGWFVQDHAASAMQKNNWQQAHALLQGKLIDNPDDPELLYDLGVVSYKKGDTKQAAAYFKQAGYMDGVPSGLKEYAFFNLGNVHVVLKQLQNAIENYEEVLRINPDNKRANHNLEKVQEMLKQQEQEQKEQQEKDKNKDQEQKQKKPSKDDSKSDDSSGGSSANDNSAQGEKEKDQRGEREQGVGDNEGEKDREQSRGDDKDERSNDKSSSDGRDNAQDESEAKQTKDEQTNLRHEDSDLDEQDKKSSSSQNKEDEQQEQQDAEGVQQSGGKQGGKELDVWLAQLLDAQEKQDAQINKRMMRQSIGKKLAGKNGQNCW